MIKLKRGQRSFLAETLGDLANVAAGALIFGQALSAGRLSVAAVVTGSVTWITLTAIGAALVVDEAQK